MTLGSCSEHGSERLFLCTVFLVHAKSEPKQAGGECCNRPDYCTYLDHESLSGNLAQVLMAQQLACGQHDASARSVLSPETTMQVQRLPCTTPTATS